MHLVSAASTTWALALLLAPLPLASIHAHAEPADWEIDPEHFSIAFAVEHIGYQQQLGMFLEGSGSFRYDPETRELHSGRVEVQARSVFSNLEARDDHLRSEAFLAVDDHPLIVFRATGFTPDATDSTAGTLSGELTLLGRSHPVTLAVTLNKRANYPFGHRRETLGLSAHTTLQRSRFGMDYGVANGLVGDEVALQFEFEAIRR